LKGHLKKSDYQHDEAWMVVQEYPYHSGTLGFLADNSTIYYQSEATGYSHLYTHNLNTKKTAANKWQMGGEM
jgi:hypothetical protein